MANKGQLTGMRGVYLVAAELCRAGLIASPTSRSAIGADILATDQACRKAYSIQVKTNARTFSFWLLNKKSKTLVSDTLMYVFVNTRTKKEPELIEYFVVPSKVVAQKMVSAVQGPKKTEWNSISYANVKDFQDRWDLFTSNA
jgi:hypothetical protein